MQECYYTLVIPHSQAQTLLSKVLTQMCFCCVFSCALKIPATLAFDTGVGNKRRILDMNKISEQLGKAWCDAILGFHWFTGW